ncbi:hypothetical protein COV23_00415 [Candidatus Wolfebacteria bacterium CG10_big_fil_rev_8_21_14_0_10_31_9]|uniref:Septum formation initiator n=1 Tax=Candidatus Wolfebacteria bacterium CG10_big_fil_rev_8_21_14_0_10_31_9 TaxID=1975070 RepID=A0A2H0RCY6_9BACT|nr:MAG: hypothetical protein COV23_00415 [Candidatus Wolfebacteria bacterium CG10_big_fil_rev_8_21_14_0_10_31_9]
MVNYFIIAILVVLIIVLGIQTIIFIKNGGSLSADLKIMKEKAEALAKENEDLQAQIEYYSKPENLEKELKAKFNYKKAEEKMMIIVP